MKTKISILDIAQFFINFGCESGDCVTHLKLQKLCYLAEAYYLALYNTPLTGESFEAWAHGPVSKLIWNKYKQYRWLNITEKNDILNLPKDIICFLKEIANVFFGYGAYQLENIVHADPSWKKARGNLAPESNCNNIISSKDMKNYYVKFLKGQ